ncbi:MAG: ABC transporter permease [Parvibaculaceae bacterium]
MKENQPAVGKATSLISIASVVIGLAAWFALASSGLFSSILLPKPAELWRVAVMLVTEGYAGRSFWSSYAISLLRVAAGFGIAVVAGSVIGMAMGLNRTIGGLLYPLIEIYRPLPALAYYSLLVLLLGIDESSKIAVLALGGLPPIVLATWDATASVRPERVEGARSLGLSRWQVICRVIFPSCLPDILTGARIGFGLSFTTLVAAEMIAATSGLGWMVYQASQYAESAVVIVGLIVMGVTGIAVDAGFRALQSWLVPWVGKG